MGAEIVDWILRHRIQASDAKGRSLIPRDRALLMTDGSTESDQTLVPVAMRVFNDMLAPSWGIIRQVDARVSPAAPSLPPADQPGAQDLLKLDRSLEAVRQREARGDELPALCFELARGRRR